MSGSDPSEEEAGLLAPTSGEADVLIGRVIADRYRIDALLGVGGMGAVYRGEHVLMKKAVAIKVLHREMTAMDEVVKRFEREAIAAGRIDHPNVTVATDFGKLEDGAFYLVLEYVPGLSLTDTLEEEGPLSVERALMIARQIAAGLGAAHAAGIVHRDLKPDNVMLIERGGTKDFVKVLDFGIAKVSAESAPGSSQLTRIGAVFGTPAYMAPEQAAGQPVDQRADLYSLGLVLYEMLAGHAAFEASEVVALLAKQLTEPPPPLPETIDGEVAALVQKLVEKDPKARFQSSEELVQAIDVLLGPLAPADGPVSSGKGARSPSAPGVPSARSSSLADGVAAATVFVGPHEGIAPRLRAAIQALTSGPRVRLLGRDVAIRVLAASTIVVLAVVVVSSTLRHGGKASSGAGAAPEAPPRELSAVMHRAEEGERAAVQELEARPEASRTAGEWMAIGKGHARLSEHKTAIEAFQHATTLDPALSQDPVLLRDVRRAADDPDAQSAALALAAGPLREGGVDVLFDVWASTSEKTETTALAKTLLDKEEIRSHASPALRVALELRRTTRCEDVKRLVGDAVSVGDERAFRPLGQLRSRSGCGFLRLSDCYPCLRNDESLPDALTAVQQRKGPRF